MKLGILDLLVEAMLPLDIRADPTTAVPPGGKFVFHMKKLVSASFLENN